jgi:dUTP pyrophosphatase
MIKLELVKLKPDATVPTYAHDIDAGADLYAYEDVVVYPGERHAVRTGIAVDIPAGYAGLIHPRSGLAAGKGLTVLNAPGTVDPGYHGEIKVIIYNSDPYMPASIKRGDRIAQLILQKVEYMEFDIVDEFSGDSDRGNKGFGSSGR